MVKLLYDCFDIKENGKRSHTACLHKIAEKSVSNDTELSIYIYDSNTVAQMWSRGMALSEEDAIAMRDNWAKKKLRTFLEDCLPEAQELELMDKLSELGYCGDCNAKDMVAFCEERLLESVKERIPVTSHSSTSLIVERVNKVCNELATIPSPIQLDVPEVETEDEMLYIGELYRAYSDEEGQEITCDNINEFWEYQDDLSDRRIEYFAAESVRRGLEELYVENLDNQFNVLKQETLSGVKDTCRKSYDSGYQRLLAVMEKAVDIQVTNYILCDTPNWISNDIRKGVCHFLIKEGKLYWVKKG